MVVAWSGTGRRRREFVAGCASVGPTRAVVFRSVDRLVRLYADGSGARVLVGKSAGKGPPAAPGRVAWSPDGKLIAFAADLGVREALSYRPDVFVMRADGSQRRRLTRNDDSFGPVWSPDGGSASTSRDGPDSHPEDVTMADGRVETPMWISSVRRDGSDQYDVTSPVAGRFEFPGSLSRDGAWLAFTRGRYVDLTEKGRARMTHTVWAMRPDGSDGRKLGRAGTGPGLLARRAAHRLRQRPRPERLAQLRRQDVLRQ